MGSMPQLDNLDIDVTVEENLAVFARLYRVDDVAAAVERTLEIAWLTDRRKDAVDKSSPAACAAGSCWQRAGPTSRNCCCSTSPRLAFDPRSGPSSGA